MLPAVDFVKLNQSCNSEDDSYAKGILKQMHDICVEVYGIDHFADYSYEDIEVPAVIRGHNTGYIGLGIVTLDLESSGEHWGTFFLTPQGVIEQGGKHISPEQSEYLSTMYIPYRYWYTVSVENDIHVNFDNVPEKVAAFLNHCCPGRLEMEHEQQECGLGSGQQME